MKALEAQWSQRRDVVTHDRPHIIKGKVTSAEIVKRVDLTPEHFKIWLRCAEPFPFEPGQYCTVGVDGVERPYSIVSSPREPLLELFVELIPPPLGHLTPLLHALAGRRYRNAAAARERRVPVAAGVSQSRDGLDRHGCRAVRQHAALLARRSRRRPAHVRARRCELSATSSATTTSCARSRRATANVRFIPTCSRPGDPRNAGWTGQTGRVHTIVEDYVREWRSAPAETLHLRLRPPGK